MEIYSTTIYSNNPNEPETSISVKGDTILTLGVKDESIELTIKIPCSKELRNCFRSIYTMVSGYIPEKKEVYPKVSVQKEINIDDFELVNGEND